MSKARKKTKARKTKAAAKAKSRPSAKAKLRPEAKAAGGSLYLTEQDVQKLVTIKDAIAALEKLFASWDDPLTANLPRQRAQAGDSAVNLMGAAWGVKGLFGLKVYRIGGKGACSHVLLYSANDSRLLAMIESDHLGRMRTGAASGIATKVLARPDARTLGVIGAGQQALTQVAAVCAVRPIETVLVFSRTPARREAFARTIASELRVRARAVGSAEAAVSDADIVTVITKSAEPVLRANWLKSGVHINAAGANAAARREIDGETVMRASVRATDHIDQAHEEAAEYRDLVAAGRMQWQHVVELGDLLTGKAHGRRGPADITLFKSLGIALEDVAFADVIYRRAVERGAGKRMP